MRTPEEKAAMVKRLIEGRARAKEERSRGRPAARAEAAPLPKERSPEITSDMSPEEAIAALGSGEGLTRESRGGITAAFDIPQRGRRDGWDYQWWPTHVVGQEVDPSYMVEIARGSWFAVPASHFPQLCPPGWQRKTIDREGQRLYMRPMRLTIEARAEMQQLAFEQKNNRLAAAQAGDSGRDMAPRARLEGIDVGVKPLI